MKKLFVFLCCILLVFGLAGISNAINDPYDPGSGEDEKNLYEIFNDAFGTSYGSSNDLFSDRGLADAFDNWWYETDGVITLTVRYAGHDQALGIEDDGGLTILIESIEPGEQEVTIDFNTNGNFVWVEILSGSGSGVGPWYSDDRGTADDHFMAFDVSDLVTTTSGYAWFIAFEDQEGLGDQDYNDLAAVVTESAPVVDVPDVVGMAQADAETAIIEAGLTVGAISYDYDCAVPSGDVISQDPAAGTSVEPGSAVDLLISLGLDPDAPDEVWVDANTGDDDNDGSEAYPFATIQKGVCEVSNGGIVNVAAGTYNGIVIIDKSVTLLSSEGAASTILNGGMQLSADNITVEGFTINNGALISGEYAGIYVVGSTIGHTIGANILNGPGKNEDPARRGIIFGSSVSNTTVSENTIGDWNSGIGSNGISDVTILENTFTSNGEGWSIINAGANLHAYYNRFSGNTISIYHESGDQVDATNNWWGDECGPGGGVTDPVTFTVADGPGDPIAPITAQVHFDPWMPNGTVYEHAEDGTTDGWEVYDNDPSGATITNVYDDDRQSRVIDLSGSGTSNGFQIRGEDGWHNTTQLIIEWSMKTDEFFQIFVEVQTTLGVRYMYYSPVDGDYGTLYGELYPHHGLGSDVIDGQWHTFLRDLDSDLKDVKPGESVIEVNGLWIRGSMRVDDLRLLWPEKSLSINDVSISEDGGSAVFTITANETHCQDITVAYATSDGSAVAGVDYESTAGTATILEGETEVQVTVPILNDNYAEYDEAFFVILSNPTQARISDGEGEATITDDNDLIWMYEDAEDGEIYGWSIYDNTPIGASITNVYDSARDSRVIDLSGFGTQNGFYKGDEDGSPWDNSTRVIIQWSMKTTATFKFFVEVETDAGVRHMYYSPVDVDYGNLEGIEYPHHGLGSDVTDGQWHTFTRDLVADLQDFQPGVKISEVDGVWIRGSMRVDDIQLLPPMGGLSINDVTISEDGGSALFTITSSELAEGDIKVNYTTVDNTAVEPGDYTATMGTATIADGTYAVHVYVDIIDDGDFEGDEIFLVVLSNPINTVIADDTGVATILDNEPGLSIDDVTVSEDGGSAMFTITTTTQYGSDIEVDYTTADHTAVEPDDYTAKTDRATITSGSTFVNVYVDIIEDGDWEKEEAFFVELSNPMNAWMSDDTGVATITDNDAPNHTVYEDAEDGLTDGWEVYDDDPEGATISNVYDDDFLSRVIDLDGVGLNNGFHLPEGGGWHDISGYLMFRWSMRTVGDFQIFVEVLTTAGVRYMYYSPVDEDYGNGEGILYPHHGLGSDIIDGQWHTFHRDLQADLEDAQPGVTINEVNGIWIRGSMRVDDIILYEGPMEMAGQGSSFLLGTGELLDSSLDKRSIEVLGPPELPYAESDKDAKEVIGPPELSPSGVVELSVDSKEVLGPPDLP